MIQYLKHEQINKSSWDACIGNSCNSLIYAYSWYLDLVSPGWEALVYEDYKMVMPLTCRNKWSINYLYQPCFVQQLGVFSSEMLNDETLKRFVDSIPSKYRLVEIKLNHLNKSEGLGFISNRNMELLLNSNYEQLGSSYSENTRRNIKKAVKNGITVKQDTSLDEIISIFELSRMEKANGYSYKEYDLLIKLNELVKNKAKSVLLSAHNTSSEILGGVLFFIVEGRAILIFSGVNKEGKKSGAMHMLIDHFIQTNANTSMVLDFEGSNDENLARFYKGFGSLEKNYPTYRLNKLPFILRLLKK